MAQNTGGNNPLKGGSFKGGPVKERIKMHSKDTLGQNTAPGGGAPGHLKKSGGLFLNTPWNKHILYIGLITLASLIDVIAYIIFVQANTFLPGGIWGIAAIFRYFWGGIPFGVYLLTLNTPLLIWGWRQMDLRFAVYTLFAMILQSVLLIVLEPFLPVYQSNLLLACIFGGALTGLGAGILVRFHASGGGIDIVGLIMKKKYDISVGAVSFGANVVIVSIAALLFGVEKAMYTIVFLFIVSAVFDKVLEGFNSKRNVMVISLKGEELAKHFMEELGRGVTLIKGRGGYSHEEKDVLICVVSRFELIALKEIIKKIDPDAFAFINDVHDVMGLFPRKGKEGGFTL